MAVVAVAFSFFVARIAQRARAPLPPSTWPSTSFRSRRCCSSASWPWAIAPAIRQAQQASNMTARRWPPMLPVRNRQRRHDNSRRQRRADASVGSSGKHVPFAIDYPARTRAATSLPTPTPHRSFRRTSSVSCSSRPRSPSSSWSDLNRSPRWRRGQRSHQAYSHRRHRLAADSGTGVLSD